MSNNQQSSVPAQPDAPPSYAMATGSSTTSQQKPSHLEVPGARNGIPPQQRRSMEDERRPLPEGWLRQYDPKEQHQFFVDTKADPPKAIWHHPYDDEDYLSTLTSEQRERIQEDERETMVQHDFTDDESSPMDKKSSAKPVASQSTSGSSFPADLPPRGSTSASTPTGKLSFTDKLKQKATGMSKEQRAEQKVQMAQQEREYYEIHQRFRQCMQQAQITGQPQWFARDPQGKDVYIEPPYGYNAYQQQGAYGYNPYTSGPYANSNARFIRPQGPYNRPYGRGYGGGMGMPIAAGALGGLMLGGLLF